MIDLGSLGGTFGSPNAVNNHSQVVGVSNMPGDLTQHPFFWDRGVLTDVGTLGGHSGVANWVNETGQVVGSATLPDGTHHAFVWRRGVMKDVGTVGTDQCTNGIGINSLGVAMGTSTDCNGNILHLFLWENGSIVNLSALIRPGSDVTFDDPVMINDRGEIAGTGEASDGSIRAVLLVPDGGCDDECWARVNSGATIRQSLRPRSETMSSPLSPAGRSRGLRYRR
jgi:probable HAF family extracellular repeat protein